MLLACPVGSYGTPQIGEILIDDCCVRRVKTTFFVSL